MNKTKKILSDKELDVLLRKAVGLFPKCKYTLQGVDNEDVVNVRVISIKSILVNSDSGVDKYEFDGKADVEMNVVNKTCTYKFMNIKGAYTVEEDQVSIIDPIALTLHHNTKTIIQPVD
jgi:hypothetical protein